MSDYVAEAGHWYDKEGKPAYTQIVASGKRKGLERPTTIRDARKLGLVPSVTGVTGILDKPALTHWMCKKAVERALAEERGVEYMEDTAAERGSQIHGAIEEWIAGEFVELQYKPYTDICNEVFANLGIKHPESERSFASPMGYGGAVDLHDREANIVLDFKTKDLSMEDVDKEKKLAYDEHCMQLAAYRLGLDMPDAKCYNLFLSRTDPTAYVLHEWSEEELQRGQDMFFGCLFLWELIKNYKAGGE